MRLLVDKIDTIRRRVSVVIVFFSAEFAQPVFDGDDGGVEVHVYFHGFHLRSVEFEQTELCIYTLVGIQYHHVYIEI